MVVARRTVKKPVVPEHLREEKRKTPSMRDLKLAPMEDKTARPSRGFHLSNFVDREKDGVTVWTADVTLDGTHAGVATYNGPSRAPSVAPAGQFNSTAKKLLPGSADPTKDMLTILLWTSDLSVNPDTRTRMVKDIPGSARFAVNPELIHPDTEPEDL